MQYALIIYEKTETFTNRQGENAEVYWGAWTAYLGALQEAGVLQGGQALQPPTMATTVRLSDGKRLVQDGPYADTKEQLGGLFVLELPSLDEALQWAARCPAASDGAVEVRPLLLTPPRND
jgi:hypothetical protein